MHHTRGKTFRKNIYEQIGGYACLALENQSNASEKELDLSVKNKYSSAAMSIFSSDHVLSEGIRTPERENNNQHMAYVKCAICMHDQVNASK